MTLYSEADFKEMPWKNGGGITTELFKLNDLNDNLLFRLSMAEVSKNGPFSKFLSIKRALVILNGNGINLVGDTFQTTLTKDSDVLYFDGHENIDSTLTDGPCMDFNAMVNEKYADIKVSKIIFRNDSSLDLNSDVFYFFPLLKLLLKINKGEKLFYKKLEGESCIKCTLSLI